MIRDHNSQIYNKKGGAIHYGIQTMVSTDTIVISR